MRRNTETVHIDIVTNIAELVAQVRALEAEFASLSNMGRGVMGQRIPHLQTELANVQGGINLARGQLASAAADQRAAAQAQSAALERRVAEMITRYNRDVRRNSDDFMSRQERAELERAITRQMQSNQRQGIRGGRQAATRHVMAQLVDAKNLLPTDINRSLSKAEANNLLGALQGRFGANTRAAVQTLRETEKDAKAIARQLKNAASETTKLVAVTDAWSDTLSTINAHFNSTEDAMHRINRAAREFVATERAGVRTSAEVNANLRARRGLLQNEIRSLEQRQNSARFGTKDYKARQRQIEALRKQYADLDPDSPGSTGAVLQRDAGQRQARLRHARLQTQTWGVINALDEARDERGQLEHYAHPNRNQLRAVNQQRVTQSTRNLQLHGDYLRQLMDSAQASGDVEGYRQAQTLYTSVQSRLRSQAQDEQGRAVKRATAQKETRPGAVSAVRHAAAAAVAEALVAHKDISADIQATKSGRGLVTAAQRRGLRGSYSELRRLRDELHTALSTSNEMTELQLADARDQLKAVNDALRGGAKDVRGTRAYNRREQERRSRESAQRARNAVQTQTRVSDTAALEAMVGTGGLQQLISDPSRLRRMSRAELAALLANLERHRDQAFRFSRQGGATAAQEAAILGSLGLTSHGEVRGTWHMLRNRAEAELNRASNQGVGGRIGRWIGGIGDRFGNPWQDTMFGGGRFDGGGRGGRGGWGGGGYNQPSFFHSANKRITNISQLAGMSLYGMGMIGAAVGITKSTVQLFEQAESMKNTLAGLVNTYATFVDLQGKSADKAEAFNKSLELSSKLYGQIRERAITSILTTQQLFEYVLAGAPQLLSKGMTFDDAMSVVDDIASLGKAMGYQDTAVMSDIRDLATGRVTVRSQVLRAVGMSQEDLQKASAAGPGALKAYFDQVLSGFRPALERLENLPQAKLAKFSDTVQQLGIKVGGAIATGLLPSLTKLANWIDYWVASGQAEKMAESWGNFLGKVIEQFQGFLDWFSAIGGDMGTMGKQGAMLGATYMTASFGYGRAADLARYRRQMVGEYGVQETLLRSQGLNDQADAFSNMGRAATQSRAALSAFATTTLLVAGELLIQYAVLKAQRDAVRQEAFRHLKDSQEDIFRWKKALTTGAGLDMLSQEEQNLVLRNYAASIRTDPLKIYGNARRAEAESESNEKRFREAIDSLRPTLATGVKASHARTKTLRSSLDEANVPDYTWYDPSDPKFPDKMAALLERVNKLGNYKTKGITNTAELAAYFKEHLMVDASLAGEDGWITMPLSDYTKLFPWKGTNETATYTGTGTRTMDAQDVQVKRIKGGVGGYKLMQDQPFFSLDRDDTAIKTATEKTRDTLNAVKKQLETLDFTVPAGSNLAKELQRKVRQAALDRYMPDASVEQWDALEARAPALMQRMFSTALNQIMQNGVLWNKANQITAEERLKANLSFEETVQRAIVQGMPEGPGKIAAQRKLSMIGLTAEALVSGVSAEPADIAKFQSAILNAAVQLEMMAVEQQKAYVQKQLEIRQLITKNQLTEREIQLTEKQRAVADYAKAHPLDFKGQFMQNIGLYTETIASLADTSRIAIAQIKDTVKTETTLSKMGVSPKKVQQLAESTQKFESEIGGNPNDVRPVDPVQQNLENTLHKQLGSPTQDTTGKPISTNPTILQQQINDATNALNQAQKDTQASVEKARTEAHTKTAQATLDQTSKGADVGALAPKHLEQKIKEQELEDMKKRLDELWKFVDRAEEIANNFAEHLAKKAQSAGERRRSILMATEANKAQAKLEADFAEQEEKATEAYVLSRAKALEQLKLRMELVQNFIAATEAIFGGHIASLMDTEAMYGDVLSAFTEAMTNATRALEATKDSIAYVRGTLAQVNEDLEIERKYAEQAASKIVERRVSRLGKTGVDLQIASAEDAVDDARTTIQRQQDQIDKEYERKRANVFQSAASLTQLLRWFRVSPEAAKKIVTQFTQQQEAGLNADKAKALAAIDLTPLNDANTALLSLMNNSELAAKKVEVLGAAAQRAADTELQLTEERVKAAGTVRPIEGSRPALERRIDDIKAKQASDLELEMARWEVRMSDMPEGPEKRLSRLQARNAISAILTRRATGEIGALAPEFIKAARNERYAKAGQGAYAAFGEDPLGLFTSKGLVGMGQAWGAPFLEEWKSARENLASQLVRRDFSAQDLIALGFAPGIKIENGITTQGYYKGNDFYTKGAAGDKAREAAAKQMAIDMGGDIVGSYLGRMVGGDPAAVGMGTQYGSLIGGFALGSTFGPYAGAVGAIAGGLLGGLFGKKKKDPREEQWLRNVERLLGQIDKSLRPVGDYYHSIKGKALYGESSRYFSSRYRDSLGVESGLGVRA